MASSSSSSSIASAGGKPRILFFSPVRHALDAYEALKATTRPEVVTSKSRAEFFEDIKTKYSDISAIYRTSASGSVAGPFDPDFISHLPPSLKLICHNGAGYDQIDIAACTSRGIRVTYAPDPVTAATADLTLFLILGALRRLNPGLASLRRGDFKTGVGFGRDPRGKVLGILGMGRIGRAVAKRAEGFGFGEIVYHNRSKQQQQQQVSSSELGGGGGARYIATLDEFLAVCDVISVHVPLTQHTRHLIGREQMGKMKKGKVVLVNTSRGAVIDEGAMAEALEGGDIAAVGLDVYEREPEIDARLMKNENALLVPHLGTHTVETLGEMEGWAMENARRGVLGEELLTVVPEQVGGRSLL